MAFVNTRITPDDIKNYDLEKNNRPSWKPLLRMGWTIDRKRNIYLRSVDDQFDRDEGFSGKQTWVFYWEGRQLILNIQLVGTQKNEDGSLTTTKKLLDIDIPSHLENQRKKILNDLREAFIVYGNGGVNSLDIPTIVNFLI